MKALFLAACIGSSSAFSSVTMATDLGQFGKSYPIAEPDMIDAIKSMLMEKQRNGELDSLNKELLKRGHSYANTPPGTELKRASKYRVFAIDPTYTLNRDIGDAEGNILFRKGFTFNPLSVKPLTRTLCFIDGDDQDQLKWMKATCSDPISFKNILVDGDISRATKYSKMRLYFDQHGYLVKHFRIEALPAIVRQTGNLLYVEELEI